MTTITDQLGRMLAGRYRLDAAIGTGASAQVFAAFDVKLGREVAVKLLHPGLAGDEAFIRRLRAEAQAVGALNHPHVLKVFDWGEEDDGAFLVLEYLAGGSLRDLLDAGRRLDPAQAASVGAQAARGLAYAHRRGFVHRDVKPANLLFDEDGVLRVADFGVARALAEAAWTEPAGAHLGTARYASPEQAEGRQLDDRADVYSLALSIYESLTGRVPFSSDTTLATLMARVGAPLPIVPELGPLAPILAQAAIPEPLARLDAVEFADRLEELGRELPPAKALPLVAVRLSALRLVESPRDSRSRTPAPRDPLNEHPGHPGASELYEHPGHPGASALYDQAAIDRASRRTRLRLGITSSAASVEEEGWSYSDPVDGRAAPALYDGAADLRARRLRRRPRRLLRRRAPQTRHVMRWVVAGLVLLVALCVGALGVDRYVVYGHVVPELVGLQETSAQRVMRSAGLEIRVIGLRHWSAPKGTVLSQSIGAGTRERSGRGVAVAVSLGRAPVHVPSVTGKSAALAESLLRSSHLVPSTNSAYSPTVPVGAVVSASPASGLLPYGGKVKLVISRGPAPVTIPSSLVGGSWASAQASLSTLRLVPSEVLDFSSTVAAGDVISTSPTSGVSGVAVGTTVQVVVSKGPRLVAVPSVKGDAIAVALTALQAAGLDVTEQIGPPNSTYATATDPAPGAEVAPGTQVTLYVA